MAGLPPLFGPIVPPPPPPPPHFFYYVPPGTVLPGPGVAYNDDQIAAVARGYHEHANNAVVRDGVILVAAVMVTKMRPESKPENVPIRLAIMSKLGQRVRWNNRQGVTNVNNVFIAFQCWQTCNEFELDPAICGGHPVLSNARLCKYANNTRNQLRQMLPVMLWTLFLGPTRAFTKNRRGYDRAFHILRSTPLLNNSEKYALVLPIIKILAAHGDEHEVLGETRCMEIFNSRNTGSSYETICRTVLNFGVYKMNWIVARCDPAHRQYSEDPDVVRPWQNGVRYEVAMILRYLRHDFPVPKDALFFCSDREKQDYIQRRCYLGGVRLPTFPQRA